MRTEEISEDVWETFLTGWRMGYRDGKHDAILDLKLRGVLNDKGEK